MRTLETYDKLPWHKQFWPWFLIVLPGTVVVAALSTVFIAFKYADSRVDDQYYSDGMAINQILEEDVRATELSLGAHLQWDTLSGEVLVNLSQQVPQVSFDFPQQLRLLLSHPVDKDMDKVLRLSQIVDGHYRADFDVLPQYRYYLRLSPFSSLDPAADEQTVQLWRLQGEIDFAKTQQLDLSHQ